ncbi:MAG: phosphoribosylamine--glycine ligase [Candidatus Omnitrophota bacterium]|nr:phosphoribosylamine--glycine ligase [Candidatus Omnitrophota bacterium]
MNILVIGSGGREHAICWKLRQSGKVKKLYCAPGNGGTSLCAENVDINTEDHKEIILFCKDKNVSHVVVGPEAPLAIGITDDLEKEGISVFGPSYAAARMESSKIFSKELMGEYNIPTAAFRIFDDFSEAEEYLKKAPMPIVVKAYGLAAGKGVIIAEDAETAVAGARSMLQEKKFGRAGEKIIVEEFLVGEEASILIVTDGEAVRPLATSQDHKRAFDGDEGPNTGGMGAYSPAPVIDEALFKEIEETIMRPTLEGLKKEGITYKGILYAGLMITEDGPKVLEYNVRFGDPETQAILPRLKTDLAEIFIATAAGKLADITMEWDARESVCIVMAAGGYPGAYEKGKIIEGIEEAEKEGALVFHAGTERTDGKIRSTGGRVLNVVGMGDGIEEAARNAYRAADKIKFEGAHFRKDIAHRAIARVKR